MERPKLTAIITGAISVILAIVYLILVQLLDSRGVMIPAPIDDFSSTRLLAPIALPVAHPVNLVASLTAALTANPIADILAGII